MPPPNTSLATAIDMGAITGGGPTTITVTIREGTTLYTVWYKYTAVTGDNVIGAWAFAGLDPTTPYRYMGLDVWLDVSTRYMGLSVVDRPMQFPVTPGTTYYFQIAPTGWDWAHDPNPPTTVTFSLRRHLDTYAPAGSIVVPDDTATFFGGVWRNFPLAILSPTDGTVRRFVQNMPVGERMAVFPARDRILIPDATVVKVYDHTFSSLLTTIAVDGSAGIQAHPDGIHAYLGANGGGAVNASVQEINGDFSLGRSWTLAAPGMCSLAVDLTRSVLYYSTTNAYNFPVKRWDLTLNQPLPDFLPAVATQGVLWEGLLLVSDGTLLIGYQLSSGFVRIVRYRSDATVVSSWDFTEFPTFDVRFTRGLDDSTIWLWRKMGDPPVPLPGGSRFTHIRIADGTTLTQFDALQFEAGAASGSTTATPAAFFGHAESCFFGPLPLDLGDPVTYQACPCPDDPWTLSTLRDRIGDRLADPAHVRWTAPVLTRLVNEALRTWNAFTGWATGRTTITLTPGVAFYQLSLLAPALRAPDVSDSELTSGINDKLLETVALTPQFDQTFLATSYGRRHQNILVESGVVLVRRSETITLPSADGRYPLDPCILAVRRVAWSENGDGSTTPLFRDDQWGEDRYTMRFPQRPARRPREWSQSTRPPYLLQLVPIPTHTGTLDFICIIDCTPIPPDWTWLTGFGVVADLLGQTGPGQDPRRAAYCEQRYRHGLEAMKTHAVVQSVRVENTLVPVHPCPDLDAYRRTWQQQTGRPREAVTFGHTLIAFSPVPDNVYEVTLDLTRIAPLPLADTDPITLPPAARDPVLDYCEHLALFQEGAGPLEESQYLLDRFFTAAGVRLGLDQAIVPSRGSLWSIASHDQRGASPHHMRPDPAQVSGVGTQPVFPNQAAQ